MPTFDELMAAPDTRSRDCRVCREPNVGQVQVRMSKIEAGGKTGRTITKTVSYCGEHAVEAFERAVEAARL